MNIGLIGCGNMGGGMAAHLLDLKQQVTCFDADANNLAKVAAIGALIAKSAKALAAQCDFIILSLPKAAIVDAVMLEISSSIKPGTIVLDTSTSEPETTKALATKAQACGFFFLDTPVSGGPIAARSGAMTMLIGGDASAIEKARALLDMLGAKIVLVGPSGAGHAAKIANNMLCAANLVLVGEVIRLGEAVGVSATDLLEGINAGSGRSGVSEVNFPKWVLNEAFDSGFTMGLMRKDVNLGVDLAQKSGVALNGFQAISKVWADSIDEISDAADFNEITKYTGQTHEQ